MTEAARLLFPAIRWDPAAGDWDAADRLADLTELGVGGYILFGGPATGVAELTTALRARSRHPILLGADLERGAGQQFDGATSLPPAAAIAWLDDPALTRWAGELTGREAVALGVDWVYAPVADLDLEPANPIVGTRAFGADPAEAGRHVAAWVDGCRAAGAMACAKHFPGHGRTTGDSHLGLPSVDVPADALDADLQPFRAAIEAGADSVMTAHVAFPALDADGVPATLSGPILQGLLRDRLRFRGIVVTDALTMAGFRTDPDPAGETQSVGAAAVRAVTAGCDVLLYPRDPESLAAALADALGHGLTEERLAGAVARVRTAAASRAGDRVDPRDVGRADDRARSLDLAVRTVHTLRGDTDVPGVFDLVTVDDDVGGPYPAPPRTAFRATLAGAGVSAIPADGAGGGRAVVVALYADIRGFKGRPGLSDAARAAVQRAVRAASSSLVVLFGHPRLADGVPCENVLCAWGGEPLMQEAAAVHLAGAAGR